MMKRNQIVDGDTGRVDLRYNAMSIDEDLDKLFENIEQAKKVTLARFIYALGIRHVGESNAKILAKELPSAEIFIESMIELANNGTEIFTKLDNLDGIGHKILIDIQHNDDEIRNLFFVELYSILISDISISGLSKLTMV